MNGRRDLYGTGSPTGKPLREPIFGRTTGDEVADELEFHVEMRARELEAQGVDPALARRMAIERFDNLEVVAAECRRLADRRVTTMNRIRYIHDFLGDIRFAVRMLSRRRAFAVLAILTIGLGIGAATAIYSLVDAVLLRPLPFSDPGRLVAVWVAENGWKTDPVMSRQWDRIVLGQTEYDALREHATLLSEVALWSSGSAMLAESDGSERINTIRATANMLPLLRVRPALGRGFLPGEDVLGGPRVAMLSWESWQSRYGGDSGMVGRSITLNETRYTVVGVLPRGLELDRSGAAIPVWVPALQDSFDIAERNNRAYRAVGRLVPGATIAQANTQASAVIGAVARSPNSGMGARIEDWQDDQTRGVRDSLLAIFGAVGLLLGIACVNVATLMLAEGARRERETAARLALGAAPSRLARQLLAENLTVHLLGGLVGVVLAAAGIRALVALAPPGLPGLADVAMDWRVLGFALACTLVTGLAFGLIPAIALARRSRRSSILLGAGVTTKDSGRLQRVLIAAEVALALVLLVGCSLLGHSLQRLSAVNPGFAAENRAVVRFASPRAFWSDDQRVRNFYHTALEDLRNLPGVIAVSGSSATPFAGGASSSPTRAEGRVYPDGERGVQTQQRSALPGFFEALDIPLQAGRTFTATDRDGGELVVIISESAARRDWPNESAIGKRLHWQGQWRTVIGIVGDVKFSGLSRDDEPTVYVPFDQYPDSDAALVVHVQGDPAAMAKIIGVRIAPFDPAVAVTSITPMTELIANSYKQERYRTLLVSLFGVLASTLAAVGMFGVTARMVSQRMHEAGIRVALGAPVGALTRLMVGETMRGVALGVVMGLPAALLVARYLSPQLFGVHPVDPVAFGTALLLLTASTLVATLPPLSRARRVDPARVLRTE